MTAKEILLALEEINEEYLEEARPKRRKPALPRLVIAASILLVGATVLTFALLGGKGNDDPIVPTPDDSTGNLIPPADNTPNNPFDDGYGDYSRLMAAINKYKESADDYFWIEDDGVFDEGAIPESPSQGEQGANGGSSTSNNGNIIENTDNQVEGIAEGDLMKMTDKYIFRLGEERNGAAGDKVYYLRIYSVDKENSKLITNYHLPLFDREQSRYRNEDTEMYISADATTLTIIRTHVFRNDQDYVSSAVGVMSLDISDVNNIKEKASVSIDGRYVSSRMVNGRLLLITNQCYYVWEDTDTSNPSDFVPKIYEGDKFHRISPECIYVPEEIESVNYSTLLMLSEGDLGIVDARAFLDYSQKDAYVSKDNIYLIRDYQKCETVDDTTKKYEAMSDISIIGYNENGFTDNGTVTIPGTVKNQYSLDERDGHLRAVTTTTVTEQIGEYWWNRTETTNASLFVINLSDHSIRASVEGFAPEGEKVASVRFEGDKLYVCTAVVVSFTDPVFFFDLSNYDNITYTDTGIIDGYSDSLINYGDGILLGIGREDWYTAKVEIYTELEDGGVLGVDEFKFDGICSTDYKAYLVNRENNLFGFAIRGPLDYHTMKYTRNYYALLTIEGESLSLQIITFDFDINIDRVRAVYLDGYLYLTTDEDLFVEKIN